MKNIKIENITKLHDFLDKWKYFLLLGVIMFCAGLFCINIILGIIISVCFAILTGCFVRVYFQIYKAKSQIEDILTGKLDIKKTEELIRKQLTKEDLEEIQKMVKDLFNGTKGDIK